MTTEAPVIPPLRESDPARTMRDSEGRTFQNCICVEMMLPLFDAELRKADLVIRGTDIMQGGYSTAVPGSANTHRGGGVFDMRPLRNHDKATRIGNSLGLIVFVRLWPNNHHYHVVVHGCPHQHAEAEGQLSGPNGYFNGGNGLARPGPYEGPRGLAPRGGWQEAYLRALPDLPTTIGFPHPKDDDVPKNSETTCTIDHAGDGWAIGRPLFEPRRTSTCYLATARLTAKPGTALQTRFVAWNDTTKSWHRYPVTHHATHAVETSLSCHTYDPNVSIFVDVFADKPGAVEMHTSALVWEL